jgi:hypothetical protein
VQLEQAHVFGRGRLWRSLQVGKPLAGADVAALRLLPETTSVMSSIMRWRSGETAVGFVMGRSSP